MFCRSILIFLLTLLLAASSSAQPLLRIQVHGKIGFIDTTGKVVIEPTFQFAGKFHSGRAVAREGGTYGYLDQTGGWIIPPVYDIANDFENDTAVAYRDSTPVLIGVSGIDLSASENTARTANRDRTWPAANASPNSIKGRCSDSTIFLADESGVVRNCCSDVQYVRPASHDSIYRGAVLVRGMAVVNAWSEGRIIDSNCTILFSMEGVDFCRAKAQSSVVVTPRSYAHNSTFRLLDLQSFALTRDSFEWDPRWLDGEPVPGFFAVLIDSIPAYIRVDGSVIWRDSAKYEETPWASADVTDRGAIPQLVTIDSQGNTMWDSPSDDCLFMLRPSNREDSATTPIVTIGDSLTIRASFRNWVGHTVTEQATGMLVSIINPTRDSISIPSDQGYLEYSLEALSRDRRWCPIRDQHAWYNEQRLIPPGKGLRCLMPICHGSISTELRVVIRCYSTDSLRRHVVHTVYSESFDGSINPGQLWHQPDRVRPIGEEGKL